MVAVDSSVWIDFFNATGTSGRAALRGLLAEGEASLIVPDLVLFEVLRGFRNEHDFLHAERLMSTVTVEPTGGAGFAKRATAHYRDLRSRGITVRSSVDVLVATFCIDNDYTLLHNDRDFDAFERHRGLRVRRH